MSVQWSKSSSWRIAITCAIATGWATSRRILFPSRRFSRRNAPNASSPVADPSLAANDSTNENDDNDNADATTEAEEELFYSGTFPADGSDSATTEEPMSPLPGGASMASLAHSVHSDTYNFDNTVSRSQQSPPGSGTRLAPPEFAVDLERVRGPDVAALVSDAHLIRLIELARTKVTGWDVRELVTANRIETVISLLCTFY